MKSQALLRLCQRSITVQDVESQVTNTWEMGEYSQLSSQVTEDKWEGEGLLGKNISAVVLRIRKNSGLVFVVPMDVDLLFGSLSLNYCDIFLLSPEVFLVAQLETLDLNHLPMQRHFLPSEMS